MRAFGQMKISNRPLSFYYWFFDIYLISPLLKYYIWLEISGEYVFP